MINVIHPEFDVMPDIGGIIEIGFYIEIPDS